MTTLILLIIYSYNILLIYYFNKAKEPVKVFIKNFIYNFILFFIYIFSIIKSFYLKINKVLDINNKDFINNSSKVESDKKNEVILADDGKILNDDDNIFDKFKIIKPYLFKFSAERIQKDFLKSLESYFGKGSI